jgi:hypothetical protein
MLPPNLAANAYKPPTATAELDLPAPVQIGANGPAVKRVQEWVTLRGHSLDIDSDFGPATAKAVGDFQTSAGLPATGVVDQATWNALVQPMVDALNPLAAGAPQSLSALTATFGQHHVNCRPLEVGGQNRGPWVRLYLGWDGDDAKWCAGFACFALSQAAFTLGIATPIRPSAACTTIGDYAKDAGKFSLGSGVGPPANLAPGSFFLVRKAPGVYEHMGIVSAVAPSTISTLEGNTDTNGSSNGYEAVGRTRGYAGKDFVIW